MGHWRRSVENLWIMRKVFFYLLCMVLILPSVGLTSLRGFLQLFIESAQADHLAPNNSTLKWNCIFLPDNGAFFVNYVITSALVGKYVISTWAGGKDKNFTAQGGYFIPRGEASRDEISPEGCEILILPDRPCRKYIPNSFIV